MMRAVRCRRVGVPARRSPPALRRGGPPWAPGSRSQGGGVAAVGGRATTRGRPDADQQAQCRRAPLTHIGGTDRAERAGRKSGRKLIETALLGVPLTTPLHGLLISLP